MDNPLIGDIIKAKIREKGGWINCHSHFDRAFTATERHLDDSHRNMELKWFMIDEMKRHTSEEEYFTRIDRAVRIMITQGVSACSTFIDADPLTELRAVKAAVAVRKKYKDTFRLLIINQVLKGVLDRKARRWATAALEYADIIGGLPSRDRPDAGKHLDIIMSWAKETGKMVHVHIDQENNPNEHDTRLLAEKTIEHGLEGRVVAIHAVSVAAQPLKERTELYALMRQAHMTVVCCPSAAISMKQLDFTAPLHNSIAPVPELIEHGIPVALGTDNIGDIYQPLVDGDMYTELRILAEACRFYRIDPLVDIATTNGRIALGI